MSVVDTGRFKAADDGAIWHGPKEAVTRGKNGLEGERGGYLTWRAYRTPDRVSRTGKSERRSDGGSGLQPAAMATA